MAVVAVFNRKGGVGKTTTAVSVAAALGLAGQRTLLVDLDPQGWPAARSVSRRGRARLQRGCSRRRAAAVALPGARGAVPARRDAGRPGAGRRRRRELLADGRRGARRRAERLRATAEHWAVSRASTCRPRWAGSSDAALRAADAVLVPVAADFLALDALALARWRPYARVEKARGRRYAPLASLPTFVDRRPRHGRRRGPAAASSSATCCWRAASRAAPASTRAALAGVPVGDRGVPRARRRSPTARRRRRSPRRWTAHRRRSRPRAGRP